MEFLLRELFAICWRVERVVVHDTCQDGGQLSAVLSEVNGASFKLKELVFSTGWEEDTIEALESLIRGQLSLEELSLGAEDLFAEGPGPALSLKAFTGCPTSRQRDFSTQLATYTGSSPSTLRHLDVPRLDDHLSFAPYTTLSSLRILLVSSSTTTILATSPAYLQHLFSTCSPSLTSLALVHLSHLSFRPRPGPRFNPPRRTPPNSIFAVLPPSLTSLDLTQFDSSPCQFTAFLRTGQCPLLRRIVHSFSRIETSVRMPDVGEGGEARRGVRESRETEGMMELEKTCAELGIATVRRVGKS